MTDVSLPPRRRSHWLIASLCLNFFLIGVVVTGVLVARNRMIATAMGGGGGALPPDVVLEMLPRSGAVKMCDVLAARVDNFRRLGREVLDSRREVFKVVRSEPFDANAFQAILDRQTAAQLAILKERQAAIADVVSKLTPEERRQFTREIVRRFFTTAKPAAPRNAGRLREMCQAIGAGSANALPR